MWRNTSSVLHVFKIRFLSKYRVNFIFIFGKWMQTEASISEKEQRCDFARAMIEL